MDANSHLNLIKQRCIKNNFKSKAADYLRIQPSLGKMSIIPAKKSICKVEKLKEEKLR
jgi:hypothetical protein